MRVLIGCEFSGVVRRAFASRGHFVVSVDLLPAEDGAPFGTSDYSRGWHYQGDLLDFINGDAANLMDAGFDLAIFHPECTFLCNSGIKWLYHGGQKINGRDPARWRNMRKAAKFYNACFNAPIARVAVENPRMHPYAAELCNQVGVQFIQPWQFGHREMKAIGLKLRNLPPLVDTDNVGPPPQDAEKRKAWARVHRASPGPDRWKERSRTLPGIADAMAEQWGA